MSLEVCKLIFEKDCEDFGEYRVKACILGTLDLCIPVIEVNILDGFNFDLYDRCA